MPATQNTAAALSTAIAFIGATEHADGQLFSTGGNVDDDGEPTLLTRADLERLAALLADNDETEAFNAWGGSSIGTDAVAVASVKAGEADGSVEAHLVVIVEGSVTECEVTLYHDKGQPTVRRRHPLGTCGTPLYGWADDTLATTIQEAEEADEDFDPRDLIGEIVHAVDEAAIAAGL